MGLDMYMVGKKYYYGANKKDDEGYDIESISLSLAYWRKHANLHGYIVQKYAEGLDECQEIELDLEALVHLLEMVKDPTQMPKTSGFFFGESENNNEQIEDDVAQITRCISFLTAPALTGDEGRFTSRAVVYRSSW